MNDLFIQGLTIDWNRVRPYNYVRQIPAISGIDTYVWQRFFWWRFISIFREAILSPFQMMKAL